MRLFKLLHLNICQDTKYSTSVLLTLRFAPMTPQTYTHITWHTTEAGRSNEESRTRGRLWSNNRCQMTRAALQVHPFLLYPLYKYTMHGACNCYWLYCDGSHILRMSSLGVTGMLVVTCRGTRTKSSSRRGQLQPKHLQPRDLESSGCGFGTLKWCLCGFFCLLDGFPALALSIYHCCIAIMLRNRTFLYLIKRLCRTYELPGWRMRKVGERRTWRDKSTGDGCGLAEWGQGSSIFLSTFGPDMQLGETRHVNMPNVLPAFLSFSLLSFSLVLLHSRSRLKACQTKMVCSYEENSGTLKRGWNHFRTIILALNLCWGIKS